MTCPICGKPATWQDDPKGPFCSERCKLIDFGNWVDEGYRVPVEDGSSEQFDTGDDRSSANDAQSLASEAN